MSFVLTTTEVALLVPVGVIAGQLISARGIRKSAEIATEQQRRTLDAQAELAREQRLWERRADVYVAAIKAFDQFHRILSQHPTMTAAVANDIELLTDAITSALDAAAVMHLFASPNTGDTLPDMLGGLQTFYFFLKELPPQMLHPELAGTQRFLSSGELQNMFRKYTSARKALIESVEAVLLRLREDVQQH